MLARRLATAFAAVTASLVMAALPAAAHEQIDPSTIPTGKPTFFTLTAANEKDTDVTKVVVTAPSGTSLGEATHSPAGWTPSHTGSAITWTGGKLAPNTFEEWGFEIDGADQPGTLNFKVSLTTGGGTEDVTVPVTVVAGTGTASPPVSTGPTVTATPTTSTAGSTATTAPSPPSGTASPELTKSVQDAKDKSSTASALAIVGIGLAAIALVIAIAALARRGRAGDAPTRPAPPAQDF